MFEKDRYKKSYIFAPILIAYGLMRLFVQNYIFSHIACELLQEGVAAIFGPASIHTRGIVASIAARYDIPHIEYVWRDNEKLRANSPTIINVFPDSEIISQVNKNSIL